MGTRIYTHGHMQTYLSGFRQTHTWAHTDTCCLLHVYVHHACMLCLYAVPALFVLCGLCGTHRYVRRRVMSADTLKHRKTAQVDRRAVMITLHDDHTHRHWRMCVTNALDKRWPALNMSMQTVHGASSALLTLGKHQLQRTPEARGSSLARKRSHQASRSVCSAGCKHDDVHN